MVSTLNKMVAVTIMFLAVCFMSFGIADYSQKNHIPERFVAKIEDIHPSIFHVKVEKKKPIPTHSDNLPRPLTKEEMRCLAENIYFEARNQPIVGQMAVAFVTLNRWVSEKFPSTVCGVVKQRVKHGCQFSWYCDGLPDTIRDTDAFEIASDVARQVVLGYNTLITDPTHGALYYHANYVRPYWRRHFERTVQIASHIFYRI